MVIKSLAAIIRLTAIAAFPISLASAQVGKQETSHPLPDTWNVATLENFVVARDSVIKTTNTASWRISSTATNPAAYLPFSQRYPIHRDRISLIAFTVQIKTENTSGKAALWCQVLDKDNKMIGFSNIESKGVKISGTSDWKKYRLELIVGSDASNLLLGAYLMGAGKVWFDDFRLEESPSSDKPATKEVKEYLDKFTSIIKEYSIYTDSLRWPTIMTNLDYLSKGMKTILDAGPATDYVFQHLRKAGDNHSFLMQKTAAQEYSTRNTNPEQPQGRTLANGAIGYIQVPGFSSISDSASNTFTQKIQDLVRQADSGGKIQGWVVDLRINTGGNMWPMLAGLAPLTGSENSGFFVGRQNGKERQNPWSNMFRKVKDPYVLKKSGPKIAVLVGPRTSSSGEMTAIAFIGRPNTRLFGQQTGGYTSANAGYPLPGGGSLYLASSYVADRTGKRYLSRITPDEVIAPVQGEDNVLKTAEKWLLEN